MNLEEIKQLNLFDIIEHYFGGELVKKKSSKYGRFYNTTWGKLWVRYDYNTGMYFYVNLSNDSDKGTLIDFIQNNIINTKNLGLVKKYVKENLI